MQIGIIDIIAVLPELIIAGFATIFLLFDLVLDKNKKEPIVFFSILAILMAALFTYRFAMDDTISSSTVQFMYGMFMLDGKAAFFKMIFYIATIFAMLMSLRYTKKEGIETGEYYILMLFSLSGMMIMASAADLMMIFLGLELMSMPLYILVASNRKDIRSNEGAMKYLIMGAVSTGVLLYGISLIYGLTGTTNLDSISHALTSHGLPDKAVFSLALIMLVGGSAFKIAGAPFHMWAPDAYEGAPTPITAFMAVAAKAAAFAVFIRVFSEALFPVFNEWQTILAFVAVFSLIVGNTVAIMQTNIKRMLAYSSVAHGGYALLGIVATTEEGMASVLLYMFVYTFISLGAFAVIISLNSKNEGKSSENISDLAGLSKTNKAGAFMMLIFMFAMAGIPPTAGFMSKFYVFMALLHEGMITLAIIALLTSVFAAFYYLRIVKIMYIDDPISGETPVMEPGKALKFVLTVCIVAAVVIGIYPQPFIEMAQWAIFN